MGGRRRAANFNLANWLFIGSLALVGLTFWVPLATARRTARVEARAEAITDLLVLAATDLQPFDFGDPGAAELLLARCRSLATADGVLTEDLELAAMPSGPATMLRLRNKHYFFQLAASPTPANQHPGKDAIAPLEVIAWPREQPSPAHTAFFASDVAEPAYTRNLQADYVGDGEQAPKAGDAYRRTDPTFERVWSYRSNNDERWLLNRRLRVRGSS